MFWYWKTNKSLLHFQWKNVFELIYDNLVIFVKNLTIYCILFFRKVITAQTILSNEIIQKRFKITDNRKNLFVFVEK